MSKKEIEIQKVLGTCNFITCTFCQKEIAEYELILEEDFETIYNAETGEPLTNFMGYKYSCPLCGVRLG